MVNVTIQIGEAAAHNVLILVWQTTPVPRLGNCFNISTQGKFPPPNLPLFFPTVHFWTKVRNQELCKLSKPQKEQKSLRGCLQSPSTDTATTSNFNGEQWQRVISVKQSLFVS